MSVLPTKTRGTDTWVDADHGNAEHDAAKYLRVRFSHSRALVHIAIPTGTLGQTVATAPLTMHVKGTWPAQTLTVKALSDSWSAGTTTWNNQPGTFSTTATVTTGILADGDEISVDIAALLQPVADGTRKWYGLLISTDSTTESQLYGFDSGSPAFSLTVETEEPPDPPSSLRPNGGVVAVGKPIVTFDPGDLDLGSVRVQVDTNNDGTAEADTGWQTAEDGQWDLSTLTYAVSSGSTIRWRAAVEDVDGNQSDYSDWASYTYRPQPTLTLDSPAAGVIWDATTEVLAHISTSNLAAYRIRVTNGTDRSKVRYDSGKRKATDPSNIALELPEFDEDGTRILRDDHAYQINVRAWDTYDREPTPGQPAYVGLWTTVAFDDDLTLTPISSLTAKQVGVSPKIRLTWQRAAAPDAWIVYRGDTLVARLDPADVVSGVSTYSWVDHHASPMKRHVYSVRAVTSGVGRSVPGPKASITAKVEDVWIVRDNGDMAMIAGPDVSQLTTAERRATYKPLRVPRDVSITTAFEGINGDLTGGWCSVLDDRHDAQQTRDVMEAVKESGETVRLVYADVSVPVELHNITVKPHAKWDPVSELYSIEFNVNQVGDFDVRVG